MRNGWKPRSVNCTGNDRRKAGNGSTLQIPIACCRLFNIMRKERIVALHFAGYTQSDSMADVAAVYGQLQEKAVPLPDIVSTMNKTWNG